MVEMRIGHCQLESNYDDFAANVAKVVAGLDRAHRERVVYEQFDDNTLIPVTAYAK